MNNIKNLICSFYTWFKCNLYLCNPGLTRVCTLDFSIGYGYTIYVCYILKKYKFG